MLDAMYKPLPPDFIERPVADLFSYRRTRFGSEVYWAARQDLRFNEAIETWMATPAGKAWLDDVAGQARSDAAKPGDA